MKKEITIKIPVKPLVYFSLMTILILLTASSCWDSPPSTATSSTSTLPSGSACSTLACTSIKARYKYLNDKNKFGYFYEIIPGMPTLITEEVVQGSVFPVDDRINPQGYEKACLDGSACSVVLEQQQPDQTYGTNGTALFGWNADGSYFEWNGLYKYSQTPQSFPNMIVVGCKPGVPGC